MKAVLVLLCFFILYGFRCCYAQEVIIENGTSTNKIDNSKLPTELLTSSPSKYSTTGQLQRHMFTDNIGMVVSIRFEVSPKNIDVNGYETNDNSLTLGWDVGMGYGSETRTNLSNVLPTFYNTGCAAYKGPLGTDATGTWRVPSQRELYIITALNEKLKNRITEGGLYASATEGGVGSDGNYRVVVVDVANKVVDVYYKNVYSFRFRCIKDLPLQ